jgi:hypothetical protein
MARASGILIEGAQIGSGAVSDWSVSEVTKSMTIIGYVFIPPDRDHDGTVPTAGAF